jgi:hypothetical protein
MNGDRQAIEAAGQYRFDRRVGMAGKKKKFEDEVDEMAKTVERGGKRALNLADRGVRKLGEVAGRDPDVRHLIERGADTVGRVIDKGAELARRGIARGGEMLEKEKAKRRRRP